MQLFASEYRFEEDRGGRERLSLGGKGELLQRYCFPLRSRNSPLRKAGQKTVKGFIRHFQTHFRTVMTSSEGSAQLAGLARALAPTHQTSQRSVTSGCHLGPKALPEASPEQDETGRNRAGCKCPKPAVYVLPADRELVLCQPQVPCISKGKRCQPALARSSHYRCE